MSDATPQKSFVPPSPTALLARYVKRQAEAQAAGLADADTTGEVQPYEAGPVQPIDAKLAWQEAVLAAELLTDTDTMSWKTVPNWPQLVSAHEPAYDLALCLGNFPQLVRNLQPLLQAKDLTALTRGNTEMTVKISGLLEWVEKIRAKQSFPRLALAVACLRLAKEFALADELIADCDASVPDSWREVWANEKAALAWHRGERDQARQLWADMADSVPVLFNRGMAALFTGQTGEAKVHLRAVIDRLTDNSSWYHLAKLYLALAESR